MDFFEKVSETLQQAGKTAGQKLKQVNEQAALNSQISAQKKAIEEAYRSVGQGFVHAHMDDEVVLYGEQILAVKKALAEIETMTARLKELKGVVLCPDCGTEVEADAGFCSACGAKVLEEMAAPVHAHAQPPLPQETHCACCGAEVSQTAAFCPHCGIALNEAD